MPHDYPTNPVTLRKDLDTLQSALHALRRHHHALLARLVQHTALTDTWQQHHIKTSHPPPPANISRFTDALTELLDAHRQLIIESELCLPPQQQSDAPQKPDAAPLEHDP